MILECPAPQLICWGPGLSNPDTIVNYPLEMDFEMANVQPLDKHFEDGWLIARQSHNHRSSFSKVPFQGCGKEARLICEQLHRQTPGDALVWGSHDYCDRCGVS